MTFPESGQSMNRAFGAWSLEYRGSEVSGIGIKTTAPSYNLISSAVLLLLDAERQIALAKLADEYCFTPLISNVLITKTKYTISVSLSNYHPNIIWHFLLLTRTK